jgi:hypothetical protein
MVHIKASQITTATKVKAPMSTRPDMNRYYAPDPITNAADNALEI